MLPSLLLALMCAAAGASGAEISSAGFRRVKRKASPDSVRFFLWTRSNPSEEEELWPSKPIAPDDPNFRVNSSVKVVIHGFDDHGKTGWILSVRDKYLSIADVNVISVDWSKLAGSSFKDYAMAAYHTCFVAQQTAKLLWMLKSATGLRLDTEVHATGFSLGAHVAGYVQANLPDQAKIARVTGLDPAALFFTFPFSPGVTNNSALFVDVIHTAGWLTSIKYALGHVDFFPNGGKHPQPGCEHDPSLDVRCSHFAAHKFFAKSILDKQLFSAKKCSSWKAFQQDRCEPSAEAHMGEWADSALRGNFYLATEPANRMDEGWMEWIADAVRQALGAM